MAELSVDQVIEMFDLQPLEGEGGFFRQTWVRDGEGGEPPIGTCILYLVTPESFSALHRLDHDEIFHFYLGDPCEAVTVDESGNIHETILGSDIASGMKVQHLVPAGFWQGARLVPGGTWALFGTTMAPGFHVSGFELATPDLVDEFAPDDAGKLRAFLASHP